MRIIDIDPLGLAWNNLLILLFFQAVQVDETAADQAATDSDAQTAADEQATDSDAQTAGDDEQGTDSDIQAADDEQATDSDVPAAEEVNINYELWICTVYNGLFHMYSINNIFAYSA